MKITKTFISQLIFLVSATAATVSVSHGSFAQSTITQTTKDILNTGGSLFGVNGATAARTFTNDIGNVIGSQLLDTVWREATIKLYKKIGTPGRETDSINSVPVRYDLYNNDFEVMINSKNDIRGLNGKYVRNFTLFYGLERIPKVFLNVAEYKSNEPIIGFMELLAGGKTTLLEHTKLFVSKPTFNAALNTGTKDTKIVKIPQYFYLKNNEIFKLTNTKKKIIEAFADKEADVKKWLDSNDINFKNSADLARLFAFYNTL
jgi:hypothetical protein